MSHESDDLLIKIWRNIQHKYQIIHKSEILYQDL